MAFGVDRNMLVRSVALLASAITYSGKGDTLQWDAVEDRAVKYIGFITRSEDK